MRGGNRARQRCHASVPQASAVNQSTMASVAGPRFVHRVGVANRELLRELHVGVEMSLLRPVVQIERANTLRRPFTFRVDARPVEASRDTEGNGDYDEQ